MFIEIGNLHKSIIIGNIYRPPRESNELITQFNDEFSKAMHHNIMKGKTLIMSGDFNINLLKINENISYANFFDILTYLLILFIPIHNVSSPPMTVLSNGHLRATFGIESCGIRRIWPNHLNLCFCIWVLIGDEFVLLYRSSLDILFGQNMLQVLRRHLVWNTSSLFISSLETL